MSSYGHLGMEINLGATESLGYLIQKNASLGLKVSTIYFQG